MGTRWPPRMSPMKRRPLSAAAPLAVVAEGGGGRSGPIVRAGLGADLGMR